MNVARRNIWLGAMLPALVTGGAVRADHGSVQVSLTAECLDTGTKLNCGADGSILLTWDPNGCDPTCMVTATLDPDTVCDLGDFMLHAPHTGDICTDASSPIPFDIGVPFSMSEFDLCDNLAAGRIVVEGGVDLGLASGSMRGRAATKSGACVPTLSEWGLIVLAAALVVAGTVVVRRRLTPA